MSIKYLDTSGLAHFKDKIMNLINAKGTYSKPSEGIPKTDLASDVQTGLEKADTALQSYTEQYTGTITGIRMNGSSKGVKRNSRFRNCSNGRNGTIIKQYKS